MKISALKQGRGNKCHVFIDGVYRLTIHVQEAAKYNLSKGREASKEDMELWLSESQVLFAKDYAMEILSRRNISEKELFDKVAQKHHSDSVSQEDWEEAVGAAVERMVELGLVDDEDYAGKLARDMANLRKMGPIRIQRELVHKGIDRELAAETVDELEFDPESAILALLEGKFSKIAEAAAENDDLKEKNRLIGRLTRLGYSYADIRRAWETYLEEYE
jgi:regulatory protein